MRLIFQWITIYSISAIFVCGDNNDAMVWTEVGVSSNCVDLENLARQLQVQLKETQDKFQQAKAAISNEISVLTGENNKAQLAIDALLQQIKSLGDNSEYKNANQQVKSLTSQLQELQTTNSQIQIKFTSFQQQVTTLTATNQQNIDALAKLRVQVQELKALNDRKEANLVTLRNRIQALGDLKVQLANKKTELTSVQQQLTVKQDAKTQCTNQLNNLNSQNSECQISITTVQQSVNNIPPAGCSLPRRSGGRCDGKFVRWVDTWGKHDVSFDVAVVAVNSVHQCRQLCFQKSTCESADFVGNTCYLNGRRDTLQDDGNLLFLDFECC